MLRDTGVRNTLVEGGIDPDRIRCNTSVRWEPSLNLYARRAVKGIAEIWKVSPDDEARRRAIHHVLGFLVRSYFDQTMQHNLGVMTLEGMTYRDPTGRRRPLLIFRSGLTISEPPDGATCAAPSRCFESLIAHGGVRHVVNLYGGTFPLHDIVAAERKRSAELGVTFFDAAKEPGLTFRKLVEREPDYRQNLRIAMERLAELIREHLLRPGGRPPRGNLYIHCGGGMHRSGMLFGVLRRCVNRDPFSVIEAEYRRHTHFRSDARPGGFEPLNLRFIKEFDCGLLTR
jgi:hypothetical protein